MSLDPFLLDILVDPEDKQALWYLESEQVLFNPRRRCAYPIRDGIPVMLVGEAAPVSPEDAARYEGIEHRVTGTPPA